MKRLDEIKEISKKNIVPPSEVDWMIVRIESLEKAIESYLDAVPAVMAQKNNNSFHFILIDRMKKSLEDDREA
jgi:hypothetical protein